MSDHGDKHQEANEGAWDLGLLAPTHLAGMGQARTPQIPHPNPTPQSQLQRASENHGELNQLHATAGALGDAVVWPKHCLF